MQTLKFLIIICFSKHWNYGFWLSKLWNSLCWFFQKSEFSVLAFPKIEILYFGFSTPWISWFCRFLNIRSLDFGFSNTGILDFSFSKYRDSWIWLFQTLEFFILESLFMIHVLSLNKRPKGVERRDLGTLRSFVHRFTVILVDRSPLC